ncbi:MAG: endonuclease III domain-containing protein [Bradyrhizobium sp.]|nr:endonuclease III domain-containing protein [Bradyrhizobium sp.]
MITLPDSDEEVVNGVRWGTPDHLGTPAYWVVRCHWGGEGTPSFACGANSLIEEIGFCLLGGYSVTFEANLAAFEWLRRHGAFDLSVDAPESQIRALLLHPLDIQGRPRRYRFPNQRATRIAAMRRRMAEMPPDLRSSRALRDYLMSFQGIGPKTASWIVRNHLGSDDVAIIDVHVLRACRRMNLFPDEISLPRDYGALEEKFLNFAKRLFENVFGTKVE